MPSKLHLNLCFPHRTGIFPFVSKLYFQAYNTNRHKLFLSLEQAVPFFCTRLVPRGFSNSFGTVEAQQYKMTQSQQWMYWVAATGTYQHLLSESYWLPAETMWEAHRKCVIRLQCFLVAEVSCNPCPYFVLSSKVIGITLLCNIDTVHFSHKQLDLKTSHWPICS